MAGRRYCPTGSPGIDDAYTGIDLLLFLAILVLCAALVVHIATGSFLSPALERGIVPGAAGQESDQLNVFGSIHGFPATTGSTGGIAVIRNNPDPHRLGAIGMTLSLFLGGTAGVDLRQTTVTWTDASGTDVLALTNGTPVVCPNWTVVNKYNVNPFRTADADLILEPGEQFDVFLCPSGTLPPYAEFMVVFDPAGPGPRFPVKCTVPFPITQTMVL